ncbi:MAG: hypothetical protein H6737_05850 [Alphaproteobacteria bacterium]|nr:hypothetical protein [Alphaproteobacteria bacterium]
MSRWRAGLLAVILAVTLGGYGWMFAVADAGVRQSLALLSAVFTALVIAVFWHYRHRLTARLVTANLALGTVVHLAFAGLIVGADRLWELGLLPALERNWLHFLIGVLAVAGSFVTWTRARGGQEPAVVAVSRDGAPPEPAPPATPETVQPPDWARVSEALAGDPVRLKQLRALERIAHVLGEPGNAASRAAEARRIVHQEVMRLQTDAAAVANANDEEDVLSQAASLLEWGAQKLPELAELDVSDLLMAKAIADIRALAASVEHVFVDHRQLLAIHPIDRATADDKCNQRADAARDALPLLEANGMRLSEELIAAHEALAAFKSVTGFQVVQLDAERYVTFEGNGRREALKRAFPERGVQVEVRLYRFADPDTQASIVRRVERVRRWKAVED